MTLLSVPHINFILRNSIFSKSCQTNYYNNTIIKGLCFGPLVHQYYEFSDAILPAENGLIIKMEKILMDQTM
ncbi:MAG: hypothetical protein ACI8RD_003887 [Bacillariaceae sp.]|jgi:hypothetical protein